MQIVIDMHEKDYQSVLNGHIPFSVLDAIIKGTPLPKGHGRIIDESQITKVYMQRTEEEHINGGTYTTNDLHCWHKCPYCHRK